MKAVHKNQDIEALRAVAVIFTVLCHLIDLVTWKGDWTALFPKINYWGGVDLFFCISGFVIAGSLIRQQRPGSFRDFAVPFYIRRIFRIWPPALFWLGVSLLATIVFNSSLAFGHFKSVLGDATAAALQVANFYYMSCTGDCGKEAVYWSLSLEEQFYLIFPFLAVFHAAPGSALSTGISHRAPISFAPPGRQRVVVCTNRCDLLWGPDRHGVRGQAAFAPRIRGTARPTYRCDVGLRATGDSGCDIDLARTTDKCRTACRRIRMSRMAREL